MATRRRSTRTPSPSLLKDVVFSKEKAVIAKWLLSCVRCSVACNPNYYMVCKAKGHFLCCQCAWLDEPRPSSYLCCNPENLKKGPPGELENLLNWAQWTCIYKANGCKETPKGLEWESHVEKCIFKCDFHCIYKNCKTITHGVDETVNHYKDKHMLTELRKERSSIKLDLIYDRCEDGVKRRLLLLKDETKHYIVGTEVTEKDFNIFIWDCSQKENYKVGESGRRYELVILPFPGDKSNAIGQLTYTGMCQPMAKTPEEIIEDADCFSISLSRLMKKYLRTFPGCSELDLCNIIVKLETKEALKPGPQLPVPVPVDDRVRNEDDYMSTLFASFPDQARIY